jgi:hypothetical protein
MCNCQELVYDLKIADFGILGSGDFFRCNKLSKSQHSEMTKSEIPRLFSHHIKLIRLRNVIQINSILDRKQADFTKISFLDVVT